MTELILASKSKFRAQMLINAGIVFSQQKAEIDERAVETPLLEANMPPHDIAEILAFSKANAVSNQNTDAYIIGSDQILSLGDKILHKPTDMEDARRRLLALSGKTHQLNTAVALVKNEEIIWSRVEIAEITFRTLTPKFIGQHLVQAGEQILSSVGAYQIEGIGVQLFEKVTGDNFTVMGLPLIQLLAELRRLEIIET